MKKLILLIPFITFFLNGLRAQIPVIDADSLSGFPASINMGDTLKFTVYISNKSPDNFLGDITINLQADTMAPLVVYTDQGKTLNSGDTVSYKISVPNVSSNNFHLGSNIVVVWPSGAGFTTGIQAQATLLVNPPSGIQENKARFSIRTYPNPIKDYLKINYLNKDLIKEIQKVRIYNILGEEIYSSNKEVYIINTKEFETGVYFLEFILNDNSKMLQKFIKS